LGRRVVLALTLVTYNSGYTAPIFVKFVLLESTLSAVSREFIGMGVGIEVWRGRIGLFYYVGACRRPSRGPTCMLRITCHWLRPLSLILMLLAIGCVETNPGPGPRNDEVMQRLDDLAREFRDMRMVLTTKLDEAVRDLTVRMLACDGQLSVLKARLDVVDRFLATNATEMADIHTQVAALLPGPATVPINSSPIVSTTTQSVVSVSDILREIDLRSAKKANIVVSGLGISAAGDVAVVTDLLHTELNITAVVSKCVRLGKPGGSRPHLLLATFANEKQATDVLRSAKHLRQSTSAQVRDSVFVNADLTHEQRTAMFSARTELRRRRAAGETDLVVRDGRVVKKSAPRASQATTTAVGSTGP